MIETSAVVLKIDRQSALVEAYRQVGCGNCDTTKGCTTGTLSKLFGACSAKVNVINSIGAKVGDKVTIAVEDGAVLKVSSAVYLAPLFLIMGGALLGIYLSAQNSSQEENSIIGASLGLVLGILWLKFYNFFTRNKRGFQPYILNKTSTQIFNVKREDK